MNRQLSKLIFLPLVLAAGAAQAVTIDFNDLPGSTTFSPQLDLPEVSFIGSSAGVRVSSADASSNYICAWNVIDDGFNCEADLEVVFTQTVENLNFLTLGVGASDFVFAQIYDAADFLIGSVNVNTNGLQDFSAFTAIKRIEFIDSSTGNGLAYDDFTFDVIAPVPLPAGLPLLLGGLGGLAVLGRRRVVNA